MVVPKITCFITHSRDLSSPGMWQMATPLWAVCSTGRLLAAEGHDPTGILDCSGEGAMWRSDWMAS